jgi:tellurite resistance protein
MEKIKMAREFSPQTVLIYVMVVTAVADRRVGDNELMTINEIAKTLPIFKNYLPAQLDAATADCLSLLDDEDGINIILNLVKKFLPAHLYETAYALACDVIAADGKAGQEELRWLEMLRNHLHIDLLHAAAIERGARARYAHE